MRSRTSATARLALLGLAAILSSHAALASDARDARDASPTSRLVAYYFHGNVRCTTCRAIEAYSQEALESAFAAELADGRLEWRPVNTDEPGNEHFIKDFQLVSKALVLVEYEGEEAGASEVLDKVWRLTGDKAAFLAYVQERTRNRLGRLP